MAKRSTHRLRTRFGIAEWYGHNFVALTADQRRRYAGNLLPGNRADPQPCPFKPNQGLCNKPSGICSIRPYRETAQEDGSVTVSPVEGDNGRPRATCPNRFHEAKAAYREAGNILLKNSEPILVPEVGFLEPVGGPGRSGRRDVGRIDLVLMNTADAAGRIEWGALEIQAVYFSGRGMADDFAAIAASNAHDIPFPVHVRRPDYRSSGPKRLLPQLQTKVPTLSRWGKRMAIVVDEYFFASLDPMIVVNDLSSADLVWIVVKFEECETGRFVLTPSQVYFTTLSEAVTGLTGGRPTTEERFIQKLVIKAEKNASLDLDAGDDLSSD